MAKVNPEALEAEAQEMIRAAQGISAEPEGDTPQEAQAREAAAPKESEDTAESEQEIPTEDAGDDVSEEELAQKKADDRYRNAQRKMTQATTEAKELRRQNEQIMAELGKLKNQLAEKDVDVQALKQVREEYPDLAAPILDEMERTQAKVAETTGALEQLQQMRHEEAQRTAQAAHMDLIRESHPDLDSIVGTGDWDDWLELQNGQVHQWVESGSTNDVVAVLTKFKVDSGYGEPTAQERALAKGKAAAEPKLPKTRKLNTGSGKQTWTVADITRMSNIDFEKNQESILAAMNKGEIRQ